MLVPIQYAKADVLHVERDAVSRGEKQEDRAKQSEDETHFVARELKRFPPCEGPGARQPAPRPTRRAHAGVGRRKGGRGLPRRLLGCGSLRARLGNKLGLFEVGNECVLERGRIRLTCEVLRRADRQDSPTIHQGNSIAARRLIHEMRRNENGDMFFARQLDQMPPEHIPCARINAGRWLVKDQHFGRMKTRGSELETLF